MDFERAIWSSINKVFPQAKKSGCSFHFSQALMKKINQIGLSQQYIGDRATRALLSQMMALVYIPPFFIRSLFETLVAKCTTPKLKLHIFDINLGVGALELSVPKGPEMLIRLC